MVRLTNFNSDLNVNGYIRAKGIYIDGRLVKPGEGGEGGLSVDDLTSDSGSITAKESNGKVSLDLSSDLNSKIDKASSDATEAKQSASTAKSTADEAARNANTALNTSESLVTQINEINSQLTSVNSNISDIQNLINDSKSAIVTVTPRGNVLDGSTGDTDATSESVWDKATQGIPVVYKFLLGKYEYYAYATSIYKNTVENTYSVRGHTIVPLLDGSITDVHFLHEGSTITLKYYPNFDRLKLLNINTEGIIDPANLPSYVDDVVEGVYSDGVFYTDDTLGTEITPETSKIYIDTHTNTTYRYSGNQYIPLNDVNSELTKKVDQLTADQASLNDAIANKVDQSEVDSLQSTINTQAEQIAALQEELIGQNATVNVSISPSNFLKYTQQNITLTASISYNGKTSDQIKDKVIGTINFTGDQPTSFNGVTSKSISKSVLNTNKDNISGSATITYQGVTFGPYTRTAYAQYPVYSGVSSNSQKNDTTYLSIMSARSSAAGTYTGTAVDGQYFYLMYPSTMPDIKSAKEGGFDVPMSYIGNTIINQDTNNEDSPVEEVEYKIYRSTNAYSAGTYNIVIS